jgi:hypothetical protein
MIRQHVAPAFELTATRSSIKEQTDSGFLPIVAGCVLEIMVDAKRIRFTVQRVSATFLGHFGITKDNRQLLFQRRTSGPILELPTAFRPLALVKTDEHKQYWIVVGESHQRQTTAACANLQLIPANDKDQFPQTSYRVERPYPLLFLQLYRLFMGDPPPSGNKRPLHSPEVWEKSIPMYTTNALEVKSYPKTNARASTLQADMLAVALNDLAVAHTFLQAGYPVGASLLLGCLNAMLFSQQHVPVELLSVIPPTLLTSVSWYKRVAVHTVETLVSSSELRHVATLHE